MKINTQDCEILTVCPFCGKSNTVKVNFEDWLDWQDTTSVQVAFPYLSANDRELLISGICPSCWDSSFPSEEEVAEDVEAWLTEGEDEDDEVEDWDDLEMGFDPYMGCYSDDC